MLFLYGFAIVAGVPDTRRLDADGRLDKALRQPFAAALTIVMVGFTTLLPSGLAFGRLAWPGSKKVVGVPWRPCFGELFGATYAMLRPRVLERVGAASCVGLTVTAAVAASVAVAHLGWVRFKELAVRLLRVMGAGVTAAGIGSLAVI